MLKTLSKWKFFMGLHILVTLFLIVILFQMDIIPFACILLIITILFIINLLLFRLLIKTKRYKKEERPKMEMIKCLAALSITLLCGIFLFLEQSYQYFKDDSHTLNQSYNVSLITLKESGRDHIDQLSNTLVYIGPYEEGKTITTVTEGLYNHNETIKILRTFNYDDMIDDLYNDSVQAIIVNDSQLNYIKQMYSSFEESTQVILTYEIDSELPLGARLARNIEANILCQ